MCYNVRMQDVNSIQQFEKLKRSLEDEDKLIRDIDNDIKKKEVEHKKVKDMHDKMEVELKKVKDNLDKVDREMLEIHKRKDTMIHQRVTLQNEFKNLERTLEDLKRRGSSPLKF